MIKKPGDAIRARILRRYGVRYPYTLMWEARREGLRICDALALNSMEGGTNVFGHDASIFQGAGEVTKAKYLEYRAERDRTGKMQGVGPVQLTWKGYQDEADKMGGCWHPTYNYRVGFHILHGNQSRLGRQEGAARYNGSGPAAEQYGVRFMMFRRIWWDRLRQFRVFR